jgi:hypothetical protein
MRKVIAVIVMLVTFMHPACFLEEALLPNIEQTTIPGRPFSFTCFYLHTVLFKGFVMLNEGTVETFGEQLTTGDLKCAQLGFEDFYCRINEAPVAMEDAVFGDVVDAVGN